MRRCILLIVMGLAAPGCDSTPTEPAVQWAVGRAAARDALVSQSGRVLDFATDAPVAGAQVLFAPFDAGAGYSATTDGNGAYQLDIPSGDYRVHVDGNLVTALSAMISSNRAHIYAGAEGCSAVYGFVGSRSGEPLQGVAVESAGKMATTDDTGWYRLVYGCGVDTGFGTMVATFTKPGYERYTAVVGRGLPRGAIRVDVGLLQPSE